ncbi:hypothetical protein TSAR_006593 [Trichomalopsis sarcophagae]|uniref:Peptidase S1 domain-containing protein n=1 Tax=Trichomalopsis sarcophagae TaxID=543379 RepID=A0A232FFB3_9HYME|nr:hypothetical protein TSAR_006593 [Trichomalopsis sarcophagae]
MKIFVAVLLCCTVLAVSARKTRITNRGETATLGEFPYQVSITAGGQHFCGGALISKKHVLTAAHCVEDFVTNGGYQLPLAVEVGSVVLGQGKSHAIKRMSYRQGFTQTGSLFLPNDIAVIHLKTEVRLNKNVGIIALPEPYSELDEGTTVIVSGFGKSVFEGPISQVLKKLVTKTTSIRRCQAYQGAILQKTNICASRGQGYGTCAGDSGGPMVDANKKTIVGVVSGGNGRCGSGDPDVFTKVSHFVSYIKKEMKIDASKPAPAGANPAVDLDASSSGLNSGSGFGEGFEFPTLSPNNELPSFDDWGSYPQITVAPDGGESTFWGNGPLNGQVFQPVPQYPEWSRIFRSRE